MCDTRLLKRVGVEAIPQHAQVEAISASPVPCSGVENGSSVFPPVERNVNAGQVSTCEVQTCPAAQSDGRRLHGTVQIFDPALVKCRPPRVARAPKRRYRFKRVAGHKALEGASL